jgi:hypothetical protein
MPRVSLPLLVTTINKKDSGVPNPDIEEVRDEQGDTLGGTCKTDGDHMLGGKYNCAWALWNTHHTVNRQFHPSESETICGCTHTLLMKCTEKNETILPFGMLFLLASPAEHLNKVMS